MLWIIFTIAATILQTFRTLEQKDLNKKLDILTVSWSRFILPLPAALVVVLCTFSLVNHKFILLCAVTGFFQIAGNLFFLRTIQSRNLGVGIAFYKTEILQSLILGVIFFNQSISAIGLFAIILTSFGIILMSNISFKKSEKTFWQQFDKTAFFGAASGLCFSFSAFSLKFASQDLSAVGYSDIKTATIVLMWVISFQNIYFALIKSAQNRFVCDVKNLFAAENNLTILKTGFFSIMASICWFTAYGIGNVVYVKAVGQFELILGVLISYWHLKEKQKPSELIGIAVTALGILILIFFH